MPNDVMDMNGELGKIWKEAVPAYFKVLSQNIHAEI
jgi:hypothetical protein